MKAIPLLMKGILALYFSGFGVWVIHDQLRFLEYKRQWDIADRAWTKAGKPFPSNDKAQMWRCFDAERAVNGDLLELRPTKWIERWEHNYFLD